MICPWCQESVDYSGENFCCAPRRERTLGTEMVFQKCPECNRTGYLKPSLCVRCKGTGIVGEWRECGGVSPAIEELLLF